LDIVVIGILAVICGADTWVDVALFGRSKESWLKTFLALPNGIPSHDTFGRVFARINPDAFAEGFASWTRALAVLTEGQVIAIDGKSLRRSHDRQRDLAPLHMVSAWATDNHLVLGQQAVADKSNEITAIPLLLEMLDLKGSTVTIDAMGCQRQIAQQICQQSGNYVLALKKNQPKLLKRTQTLFAPLRQGGRSEVPYDHHCTMEKNGGRMEQRECWSIGMADWRFYLDPDERWEGLQTLVMIHRTRKVNGELQSEWHYYIASLPSDAERLLNAVRTHWDIENGLHWILDIAFDEDQSRLRSDNGQFILSVLRRLALNLLRQDTTTKAGVKARRKRAGWDNDYLISLLTLNA
jgi:predicted transposase YbfD/YdcC